MYAFKVRNNVTLLERSLLSDCLYDYRHNFFLPQQKNKQTNKQKNNNTKNKTKQNKQTNKETKKKNKNPELLTTVQNAWS
jgi:hypothetical protein